MTAIVAPWTRGQADALNEYQRAGRMHPFTCGGESCGAILFATTAGWRCHLCDYTQNWAHEFMAADA